MRLALVHLIFELKRLLRAPVFWVPAILFPAMLYAFFGASLPPAGPPSQRAIASFAIYAVLGVGFYLFGIRLAQDRASPFSRWMRSLAGTSMPQMLAHLVSALLFSAAAIGVVFAASLALAKTGIDASAMAWVAGVGLLAALPASLMGLALGLVAPANAAPALANLIYLPLAFLGGLWVPPDMLPATIARISSYTPVRPMGELAWAVATSQAIPRQSALVLGLWTFSLLVLVLTLAWIDQKRMFS